MMCRWMHLVWLYYTLTFQFSNLHNVSPLICRNAHYKATKALGNIGEISDNERLAPNNAMLHSLEVNFAH